MNAPPRLTRAQARELDRLAEAELGLPTLLLMENAGAGAARVARESAPRAQRVLVACGAGNNGGDGWVVARHLASAGLDVRVLTLADPAELAGDAAIMARAGVRMGLDVRIAREASAVAAAQRELGTSDLAVDALLGTGSYGAPRANVARAIELLAASGAPVLALDLPSGLDADTGLTSGACVRATWTATFAAEKFGFAEPAARAWLGKVRVVDLGLPRALLARALASPAGSGTVTDG